MTLAEKPADPAQYPGAKPPMLGALLDHVQEAAGGQLSLSNHYNWWVYVRGRQLAPSARTGRPEIRKLMDHPVAHVAYEDVEAYATLGGQGTTDRGRMGIRRARRAGWTAANTSGATS